MRSCTFFGHRNCPDAIKVPLREVLTTLIIDHNVTMFYVGNQGHFDAIVRSTLRELKKEYTQIDYAVVLAYIPERNGNCDDFSDTMFPEGMESVHPRFAISWRNSWMLRQADYVVTYVTHHWGGAAQFAEKARLQKKRIFPLADSREDFEKKE